MSDLDEKKRKKKEKKAKKEAKEKKKDKSASGSSAGSLSSRRHGSQPSGIGLEEVYEDEDEQYPPPRRGGGGGRGGRGGDEFEDADHRDGGVDMDTLDARINDLMEDPEAEEQEQKER